jgi:hypothetical protein
LPGDFQETRGPFDGEHFAGRPDDFSEIHRCVSWPGAHVDDTRADGYPRASPAISGIRTPHSMLQAKPRDFFIVGA